jgi:hypothetical protein
LPIRDWYWEGAPEFDPITELQKLFLEAREEEVIPLLSKEERVNVRIVGYKEWISTLDKYEAMDLIGEIKDQKISKRIVERELFRRKRYKRLYKRETLKDELQKRDEGRLKNRKWWETNPIKKDDLKR